jgi:hypothetical protein
MLVFFLLTIAVHSYIGYYPLLQEYVKKYLGLQVIACQRKEKYFPAFVLRHNLSPLNAKFVHQYDLLATCRFAISRKRREQGKNIFMHIPVILCPF